MALSDLDIIFHIGLHKTGTTFMQRNVFPAWPALTYLRFRNLEYFLRLSAESTYLVSCEGLSGSTFASRSERIEAVRRLSEMFPPAKIIISFRRHGDYIGSLYSQYLRYGGKEPFSGFFSLDPDGFSLLQPADITFGDLLAEVSDHFESPPFVYTADDIRDQLPETLDDLSAFLGVAPPPPLSPTGSRSANAGLRRGSAEILRSINRLTRCSFSNDGRRRPYRRLARLKLDPPTLLMRCGQWIDGRPIIDPELKKEISDRFDDDWRQVLAYRDQYRRRRILPREAGS